MIFGIHTRSTLQNRQPHTIRKLENFQTFFQRAHIVPNGKLLFYTSEVNNITKFRSTAPSARACMVIVCLFCVRPPPGVHSKATINLGFSLIGQSC